MFPSFKLKSLEKLWLKLLCQKILANEKVSYRILRSELDAKLPLEFNPNQISRELVGYGGERITLLGIHIVMPKLNILEKTNKVIKGVRMKLIELPDETRIVSSEISSLINDVTEQEVALILSLITDYGNFWNSSGRSKDYYGVNEIEVSEDAAFISFTNFISIEELIIEHSEKSKSQLNSNNSHNLSSSNLISSDLSGSGITINPFFKSRIAQIDYKLCFVLMPFTESWSDRIYKNYIREVIEKMQLQCLRADNLTGLIVIEDIWTKINQAAVIIADVTNRNPNVMYELGIAHTLGKPVILITQNITSIPFDFRHLRHYEYLDNYEGCESFKPLLKSLIDSIYDEFYPGKIMRVSQF